MTVPAMSTNGEGHGSGVDVASVGGRRDWSAWMSSGRVFVSLALTVILLIAGGLGLAFRHWRTLYEARVRFGEARVAKAVDPLAEHNPPGVDPGEWRRAVADTHAMLEAAVQSNLLDTPQLELFGARIDAKVAAALAHPETEAPRAALAAVWDDIENGPGFLREVLKRRKHARPACLPPRQEPDRVTGKMPGR